VRNFLHSRVNLSFSSGTLFPSQRQPEYHTICTSEVSAIYVIRADGNNDDYKVNDSKLFPI